MGSIEFKLHNKNEELFGKTVPRFCYCSAYYTISHIMNLNNKFCFILQLNMFPAILTYIFRLGRLYPILVNITATLKNCITIFICSSEIEQSKS